MFMAMAVGTKLGAYELGGLLGAGGMGEVYRARDPRLQREVAVKVLPASFASDTERLRRFELEARAAAALNHPNILAVYDIGTQDGTPYIVSELLEGETLRERLRGGPSPIRKAMDYAQQIARGLAAAHDKGIVHRDLKPENIFITHDGRVKILDFGLAKLTRPEPGLDGQTQSINSDAGTVLGTVGYMSPEQVRGTPADARSDLFSFGAILYEMLSGKRAFQGETMADTMSAILHNEPPELTETNLAMPPTLERLVRHCPEKKAAERFQSARDVAFDLDTLISASSTSKSGAEAVQTKDRAADSRRKLFRLAGMLALAVALVGLGGWLERRKSASPPPGYQQITFVPG
jgi:eukaryotic-like serine/threonine-protein kinase